MQEFNTAVRDVTEVDEGFEFSIDGETLRAYQPSDGQLAMLMATIGRGSAETDAIAGVINFFVKVLDKSGATYIENRLLDRDDDFGLAEVEKIMEWMIEEWSGRPTKPLSVSTRSPESDGPKSTPTTTKSTSSGSLLTDS